MQSGRGMMHPTRTTAATLAWLALAPLAGCDMNPDDEVEELGGKADGATLPLGTYDDFDGPGRSLVLLADKSFLYWDACGEIDAMLGCEELEVEGTYRLTRSGSRRFITLTDEDGERFDRFRYRLVGGDLELRQANADEPSALPDRWTRFEDASVTFCKAADWCGLQDLPGDGVFACEAQACVAAERVVSCVDGVRSFTVDDLGDEGFLGRFTDFPSLDATPDDFECALWNKGSIRYRCWGDAGAPPFEQINVLRFASGSPGVEFNLVSEKNEPGGGDVLFSILCDDDSSLDF